MGSGNVAWTLDDTGKLSITGTGIIDSTIYGSHTPWFSKRTSIKSVVINSTIQPTTMQEWFASCTQLTSANTEQWGFSQMNQPFGYHGIFDSCSSLNNIDISQWNVSHAQDLSYLFMVVVILLHLKSLIGMYPMLLIYHIHSMDVVSSQPSMSLTRIPLA